MTRCDVVARERAESCGCPDEARAVGEHSERCCIFLMKASSYRAQLFEKRRRREPPRSKNAIGPNVS